MPLLFRSPNTCLSLSPCGWHFLRLWSRVPREQQVSKQTPATCHQDGYSATRGLACKASGGRGSVMEGKFLHSHLHLLVPRLPLFLRSTDHALSAA